MSFGERIKNLRQELNRSQKEVADVIGVSISTISKYERSALEPDIDTISTLAKYFNVSTDYILDLTDRKLPGVDGCNGALVSISNILEEYGYELRSMDKYNRIEIVDKDGSTLGWIDKAHLISNYENCKDKNRITVEDILGYLKNTKLPNEILPFTTDNLINIPVFGRISAGYPQYAETDIEEYYPVDLNYARMVANAPQEYFYLRVKGNSMVPTIPNGCLVLIHSQNTIDNDKQISCVICNGDEATLKRARVSGRYFVLESDNLDYPPQVYPINECKIIGKVVRAVLEF